MKSKNRIEKQNGIDFIGNTKVSMNKKVVMNTWLLVLQFALIISGVYGTIFGFTSAFDIKVNKGILFTTIIIFTFAYCIIYKYLSSNKYIIPILSTVYLISAYTFRHEIWYGFIHIENVYIEKFNSYYNTNLYKYLAGDYVPKQVITTFFIFIIILLTGLISGVIFKNVLQSLYIINTLPIIFLSFTVGLIPGTIPFTAFLVCCIGVYGISSAKLHKDKKIRIKEKQTEEKHKITKHKNTKHNLKLEQKFKYMIGLKVGGVLSLSLLFLFVFVSLLFTPKFYKKNIHVEKTKHNIQNTIMNFSIDDITTKIPNIKVGKLVVFQNNTASGGLSEGKLGTVGKLKYKYETALKVKTSVTGHTTYLKGYVGCLYQGNKWISLSDEDKEEYDKIATIWDHTEFNINNLSSYFMSLLKSVSTKYYPSFEYLIGNMQIENVSANPKYIYSPYYSSYPLVNDLEENFGTSILTKNKKKKQYNIDFYLNADNLLQFNELNEYGVFSSLYSTKNNVNEVNHIKTLEQAISDKVDEYRTFESVYRDYVYDVYTKMPESGLEILKEQFKDIEYSDYRNRYQDEALTMIILQIRKFLDDNTSYSLEPGVLPKGKDFIEYFIYENKLGYCTHYATAATMILRSVGIPARYVEGYIIKESDIDKGVLESSKKVEGRVSGDSQKFITTNKIINILDSNAHAWVEIYIDGFGWVPVEFTPGYSSDITLPQSSLEDPGTISAGNFESNNNQVNKDVDKKNNRITPTPTVINENLKDKTAKSNIDSEKNNNQNSISIYLIKVWLIIKYLIGILITSILIILIRAYLIRFFRNHKLHSANSKERTIILYKEIKRVFDHYNLIQDDTLTEEQYAEQIEQSITFMEQGGFKRFTRIALRARFDRTKLSKQELEEADIIYARIIKSIYDKATFKEKLFLKYIKNFY